jgi:hypothetical protein
MGLAASETVRGSLQPRDVVNGFTSRLYGLQNLLPCRCPFGVFLLPLGLPCGVLGPDPFKVFMCPA